MAKLNTTRGRLLAKLINPKTGTTRAVRSDGALLSYSLVGRNWRKCAVVKASMTPEQYIACRRDAGWLELKRGQIPAFEEIEAMANEGVTTAVDGCEGIEPDGHCFHGSPSWVSVAMMI